MSSNKHSLDTSAQSKVTKKLYIEYPVKGMDGSQDCSVAALTPTNDEYVTVATLSGNESSDDTLANLSRKVSSSNVDLTFVNEVAVAGTSTSAAGVLTHYNPTDVINLTVNLKHEPDDAIIAGPLSHNLDGATFELMQKKNTLVVFTIHNCPSDDGAKRDLYNSYVNQYGINLNEYEDKMEHRMYNYFNNCVKELDFAVMCNLFHNYVIGEPTDYFAFYRENLALVFEQNDVSIKGYVDNAHLYTYKHIECFQALCNYRKFIIENPKLAIPQEIASEFEKVRRDKCCKKFSRRSFYGVFRGTLTQNTKSNGFCVHVFQSNAIYADIESDKLDVHLHNRMRLGNEIKVRDVSSPKRFVKIVASERRNLATIQNKPSTKTGPFTEAQNEANGVFVFNGFNVRHDFDSNLIFLSFNKLLTFIPA